MAKIQNNKSGDAEDAIDVNGLLQKIDINKSHRAAQNAMDEMRKRRVKYGRIKISRGARLGTGRRTS